MRMKKAFISIIMVSRSNVLWAVLFALPMPALTVFLALHHKEISVFYVTKPARLALVLLILNARHASPGVIFQATCASSALPKMIFLVTKMEQLSASQAFTQKQGNVCLAEKTASNVLPLLYARNANSAEFQLHLVAALNAQPSASYAIPRMYKNAKIVMMDTISLTAIILAYPASITVRNVQLIAPAISATRAITLKKEYAKRTVNTLVQVVEILMKSRSAILAMVDTRLWETPANQM